MILSCLSLLIYASLLVIVTYFFHIRSFSLFFGHCYVIFPYMEPLSFFGWFVQEVILSCFSDSFVQKTAEQTGASADVMLQVIPSFYTNYSKTSVFFSAQTYENYIVSKEYCIARHDDKMCFLPKCSYHIMLIGNIKELLQKLDAFCFNYQQVDCLYTFFKYRFIGKIFIKSGKVVDNLQRAVHFNQQNRAVERMPSIAEKRLLRKKYKKHLLSSLQKTKSTQTSGSVFGVRTEQGKKTKFEL